MTASSSFSPASVGAENGRLGTERGGGAWCPAHLISRASDQAWLEVELARDSLVTGVITQGRYAGGHLQQGGDPAGVRDGHQEGQGHPHQRASEEGLPQNRAARLQR